MFDLIDKLKADWSDVYISTRDTPDFKERVKYVSAFTHHGNYVESDEIYSISYEVDDITQTLDSVNPFFVDDSLKFTMKSGETLSASYEPLNGNHIIQFKSPLGMHYVIGDIESVSYKSRGVIYNVKVKDKQC